MITSTITPPRTHLPIEGVRHRERAGNPAERVQNMRRYAAADAANRLPHILRAGDDQAAAQQHHRGEHVVQPKHGVVDLHLLRLEVALQIAQQLVHVGGVGRAHTHTGCLTYTLRWFGLRSQHMAHRAAGPESCVGLDLQRVRKIRW